MAKQALPTSAGNVLGEPDGLAKNGCLRAAVWFSAIGFGQNRTWPLQGSRGYDWGLRPHLAKQSLAFQRCSPPGGHNRCPSLVILGKAFYGSREAISDFSSTAPVILHNAA